MKKIAILMVVAVAFGGVLWMKSRTPKQVSRVPAITSIEGVRAADPARSSSVLLFADPREADAKCGCAEVIRLARDAASVPGVVVREFDTRKGTAEAKQYSVRVSPTVIITDADGAERTRFEGESQDVITKLHGALTSLQDNASRDKATHR